jgi:F-type H+-transporting ATPase subunit delta
MKDTRVAKRYAAALFAVASRDGILDAVEQDLTLVERFIAEVPYLRAVLLQPLVSEDRKVKVATDAFGDRTTGTTLNFIKLLIRKRREDLIDDVIRNFRILAMEKANLVDAEVSTAVPLSPSQEKKLTASLQKLTGKTVRVHAVVDGSILGGVVVRLGDTIIDGSVRGRLERLREHLLGAGGTSSGN